MYLMKSNLIDLFHILPKIFFCVVLMLTFVRSELDWGYSRNALTPDTLARAWWKPGGFRTAGRRTSDPQRENLGYDNSPAPARPCQVAVAWARHSHSRAATHCREFPGVSWFLAGTRTQCYNLSFAQYLHNSKLISPMHVAYGIHATR